MNTNLMDVPHRRSDQAVGNQPPIANERVSYPIFDV
jgi:hypothetical protein